jgi:hypothetical protein
MKFELEIKLIKFYTFFRIWNIFIKVYLVTVLVFFIMWFIENLIYSNFISIINELLIFNLDYMIIPIFIALPAIVIVNLILNYYYYKSMYYSLGHIYFNKNQIKINLHNNTIILLDSLDSIVITIIDYTSNNHFVGINFKNRIVFKHRNKRFAYYFIIDDKDTSIHLGKILNEIQTYYINLKIKGHRYLLNEDTIDIKGTFTRF